MRGMVVLSHGFISPLYITARHAMHSILRASMVQISQSPDQMVTAKVVVTRDLQSVSPVTMTYEGGTIGGQRDSGNNARRCLCFDSKPSQTKLTLKLNRVVSGRR